MIPESDGSRTDDAKRGRSCASTRSSSAIGRTASTTSTTGPKRTSCSSTATTPAQSAWGRTNSARPVMMAAAFSTSNAHGCNYCMVHSKATGGEMSLGMGEMVEAARDGTAPKQPHRPVRAGAGGPRGGCDQKRRFAARNGPHRRAAPTGPRDVGGCGANIMGTAMIASAFGFLNVFNDLSGVKVEAEWPTRPGAGGRRGGSPRCQRGSGIEQPRLRPVPRAGRPCRR